MTERERLAGIIDNYKFNCIRCYSCDIPDSDCAKRDSEALTDYLLANGVIVPKYKIGDKVYFIKFNTIYDATVTGVAKVKNSGFWYMLHTARYKFEKIESSLYETKEQAEKALKECKNK